MKQRQYYSANINGLEIVNLEPLRFQHVVIIKDIKYYLERPWWAWWSIGRWVTAETGYPTNYLEEATDWLIEHVKKHPDMNLLKREGPVPYLDQASICPIDVTDEEAKQLELKRKQSRNRH